MLLPLALLAAAPQAEDPSLLFTIDGPGPERFFGSAIVETQDLDGDGLVDLGFPTEANGIGRLQVLSAADRSVLLDVTADRLSARVAWIGDSTGDGIGEVLTFDVAGTTGRFSLVDPTTGALVTPITPTNGTLDVGLRPAFGRGPDVNGDGELDFWLRSRTGGSGATTYFEVRSGAAPTQTLYVLTVNLVSDNGAFEGVDVLADVDGDGVDDWLVGDDSIVQGGPNTQRGRLRILSGASGAQRLEIRGDSTSQEFGRFVRNVGDLNGDGREDLLARVRRPVGHVVELFSGADGARLFTVEDPIENPASGAGSDFGASAAGLGDVDGDGVSDFCVGAPGSNEFVVGGGAVFVHSGATGALIAETRGLELNQDMGASVLGAGDLDGDGRADWYAGSPQTSNFSPDLGKVEAYGLPDRDLLLTFEVADDLLTPLPNGAAADDIERFGRVVRISSEGPNQVGPAVFDSSPNGPNAGGTDPDLLVDRGNLLILQEDPAQTVPGIYDTPDDAAFGGVLRFELIQAARPRSIVLVDVDPMPPVQDVVVRLVDGAGRVRTYTAPGGFTLDAAVDPGLGARSLRLDTLEDQPGATATATAVEDQDFDARRVALVEVELVGSGAVDDLRLSPGEPTPVDASRLIRTIPSPTPSNQFARDIAALGDIDGDGTGEIAIGSGPVPGEPFGRVTVHRGSDGSIATQVDGPPTPQGLGTFGQSVGRAGDLDGDGVVEVLVGAFRDRSSPAGPQGFVAVHDGLSGAEEDVVDAPATNTNFGGSVASISDLDGDGVRDIVVGANQAAGGDGEIHVLSGASRQPFAVHPGDPTLRGRGSELTNLGDVDGDGVDDVGGYTDIDLLGSTVAAFEVISPVTGALLYERRATIPGDVVPGYRSAPMGDLDSDGSADFAFVTLDLGLGDFGALTVVSGGTGAVLFELTQPAGASGAVAEGCASPGDLDGDGVRDLVIHGREPDAGPIPGREFVAGISGVDFRELFRRRYGIPFQSGSAVTDVHAAGDVDGDGFGDVAVTLYDSAAQDVTVEILGFIRRPASVVCVGEPNSTGSGARLRLRGSTSIAANDVALEVQNLPPGSFSVLAVAQGLGRPPIVSDGVLCLDAASLLRLPPILGGAPIVAFPVDVTALPTVGAPGLTAAAFAGETRYFQAWYRDSGAPTGSNFSDALAVTFVD